MARVRIWVAVVAMMVALTLILALPLLYITMFVDLQGERELVGHGPLRPKKALPTEVVVEEQTTTQDEAVTLSKRAAVERPPVRVLQPGRPTVSAPPSTGDVRSVGAWEKKVTIKHRDVSGHPRRFVYESYIPGFRLQLPVMLDGGDRGSWVGREHPFSGCQTLGTNTCKKEGSDYGTVTSVHTYASFSKMPSTPCIRFDFEDAIHYHNIKRIGPSGGSDELLDNAVDGMEANDRCDSRTLVPLFVPQGAYFAHFMDGVFPRLVAAMGLREARGEPEHLHILLYPAFKSTDTEETLSRLPNVTWAFESRPPFGVCFKRIVSVCYNTPGLDPRAGTEINRFIRNAFYDEHRPAPINFAGTIMNQYFNGSADTEVRRHALVGSNPLYPSPKCTTRVYAGRKKNNRNGRTTPNENEIIAHLRNDYGFVIFEGGESMKQWADAMKNACIFIGAHGGALSHMFWLNPDLNPAVIEFDGYNKYSVFWYIAASMGFNYGWMGFDRSRGVDLARLDALMGKFGVLPALTQPTTSVNTAALQ